MANLYSMKCILTMLIFICGSGMLLYMTRSLIGNRGVDVDFVEEPSNLYEFKNSKMLLEQVVYLDRQEHLLKMCQLHTNDNSTQLPLDTLISDAEFLEHVLVDLKHRLLYCYVPKVACTNWKRVFMILSGISNTNDPLSIPADLVHKRGVFLTLNNFTAPEIKHFLTSFTKFLFVRNPFERLLSAYRNKFERHYVRSSYFQSRFGRHIVKNYRQNATKVSLQKGDDVTFSEFVAYLTGPEENVTFNEHWKSIGKLCWPCSVKYDFIGKYETLYKDSNYLLKMAGTSSRSFPKFKPSNTSYHLKKYFTSLSSQAITRLYNLYQMDFKMFNYNLEGFLGYEIG